MKKLIRITTIPLSLEKLLEDQGRYFKTHYNITFVAANVQKLEVVAEQQGVDHFPLEMTRKITPFKTCFVLYGSIIFYEKKNL